ncbi:MAG: hypothetical protein ACOZF0_08665 [Thermodesulfobacteriota bacterium]
MLFIENTPPKASRPRIPMVFIDGQRRQHARYQIRGCARAVFFQQRILLAKSPRIIRLGPIIDIGRGGLAVEYLESRSRSGDFGELSVEMPDKSLVLYRFPVQTIADYPIAEMNSGQLIRRRCLQFLHLNQHQLFRLGKFIRIHTCGPMIDRRSGRDRRYPQGPEDPFIAIPGWCYDKGRRRKPDRRKNAVSGTGKAPLIR